MPVDLVSFNINIPMEDGFQDGSQGLFCTKEADMTKCNDLYSSIATTYFLFSFGG